MTSATSSSDLFSFDFCLLTFDLGSFYRLHNMASRDAVVIEQLVRRAAPRDFRHCQPLHREATAGHRCRDGIADAAGLVMILDRDEPPLCLLGALDQRRGVDRLQ